MKKILTTVLTVSLLLIGVSASAQWTAGGGYTGMGFSGPDRDVTGHNFSLSGFYAGIRYDLAFSALEGLTFEPGVFYQHYGKKHNEKSYQANYINVPINIRYSIPVFSDFTLAFNSGPRLNFGFAGSAFNKNFAKGLALKNFDAQWGVGAGIVYSDAIHLRCGYDFGIMKALKDTKIEGTEASLSTGDLKIKRNTFYIGLSFLF